MSKKDTEGGEKPKEGVENSHVQEEKDTEMTHPKEKGNVTVKDSFGEIEKADDMVPEETPNPAPVQEAGESMKDHTEEDSRIKREETGSVEKKPVDAEIKTVEAGQGAPESKSRGENRNNEGNDLAIDAEGKEKTAGAEAILNSPALLCLC